MSSPFLSLKSYYNSKQNSHTKKLYFLTIYGAIICNITWILSFIWESWTRIKLNTSNLLIGINNSIMSLFLIIMTCNYLTLNYHQLKHWQYIHFYKIWRFFEKKSKLNCIIIKIITITAFIGSWYKMMII